MGLSISKQGVISASGENVNPNLLAGSNIFLKDTTGNVRVSEFYTIPDLTKLKAGTNLVVSCDIEVYNVASMSRIGVEPSFFYTGGGTNQIYIGKWTNETYNRKQRIYATYTLSYDVTGYNQCGIYIQNVVYNTGGYTIVSKPKLEIGTYPTPWCPHVNDAYYAGSNCGFFESSNPYVIGANTSFNKNYIITKELIEI